jgi:hypothetical protein
LAAVLRPLARGWLQTRERWAPCPTTAVLILAHMRSGSTLLQHLLISHPDVVGGGERNVRYETPADLQRLTIDAYYHSRQFWHRDHFAVDQINHTRLFADPALVTDRARAIFLVREPEPAIASMVEVLGPRYDMTLEQAVAYYRTRLADLVRLAGGLADADRALFVTYDALIERTRPTLETVSRFLRLSPGLEADYHTFRFTGRVGDPSPMIKTGTIARPPLRDPVLSSSQAAELQAHYTATCAQLEALCGVAAASTTPEPDEAS